MAKPKKLKSESRRCTGGRILLCVPECGQVALEMRVWADSRQVQEYLCAAVTKVAILGVAVPVATFSDISLYSLEGGTNRIEEGFVHAYCAQGRAQQL